jgi:hypothetical protein
MKFLINFYFILLKLHTLSSCFLLLPLFCHPEPFFLSPRALLCHPEPFFCHPEPFFVTPSPSLSPRALFFVAPSPFLSPRALFVAPSGSEGSLGPCLLRDDKVGCTPCHSEALAPFCHSEALAEEPRFFPKEGMPRYRSARQSRAETLRNLLKNSATPPVYSYTIQSKSKLINANSMPEKLYELFPLILN